MGIALFSLRGEAIDLRELNLAEIKLVKRCEVLVELLHRAHADDGGGHARVAQHPRQRHLRQRLTAPARDVAQRRYLLAVLLHGLLVERVVLRGAGTLWHTVCVAVGQLALRQRRERYAAEA